MGKCPKACLSQGRVAFTSPWEPTSPATALARSASSDYIAGPPPGPQGTLLHPCSCAMCATCPAPEGRQGPSLPGPGALCCQLGALQAPSRDSGFRLPGTQLEGCLKLETRRAGGRPCFWKVHIRSLYLYTRPTCVPVFTKEETPERIFTFPDEQVNGRRRWL